jgi:predicted RNA polymerase sigma factor
MRLPARQRAVLVLRYYEDLSEADIAERLGCAPGTVKSSAARALRTLRELLAEYERPGPGEAEPLQARGTGAAQAPEATGPEAGPPVLKTA